MLLLLLPPPPPPPLLLLFSSLMPVREGEGKWRESEGRWRAALGINDDQLWSLPLLADFCRFSLPVPASVRAALETGYVYARRRTPTDPQTQMHTRHKCIQAHALYHTGSDLAFPGATVVLAAFFAGGTTTDVSPCQVQLSVTGLSMRVRVRVRTCARV
jgi:hypothetical protein